MQRETNGENDYRCRGCGKCHASSSLTGKQCIIARDCVCHYRENTEPTEFSGASFEQKHEHRYEKLYPTGKTMCIECGELPPHAETSFEEWKIDMLIEERTYRFERKLKEKTTEAYERGKREGYDKGIRSEDIAGLAFAAGKKEGAAEGQKIADLRVEILLGLMSPYLTTEQLNEVSGHYKNAIQTAIEGKME